MKGCTGCDSPGTVHIVQSLLLLLSRRRYPSAGRASAAAWSKHNAKSALANYISKLATQLGWSSRCQKCCMVCAVCLCLQVGALRCVHYVRHCWQCLTGLGGKWRRQVDPQVSLSAALGMHVPPAAPALLLLDGSWPVTERIKQPHQNINAKWVRQRTSDWHPLSATTAWVAAS